MERENLTFSAEEAASALSWWADAGVDTIVADEPRDWLNPKTPAPVPAAPVGERQAPAAAMPATLEAFRDWLLTDPSIPFAAPSLPRVGPSGDPAAGLTMMIDMPSPEDVAAGGLLSGEAGRLFDRMLAAIGRDRGSIYLASLSPIRPPAGRLDGDAAAACAKIARHHLGLAAPKAVLLFGNGPARALLGGDVAATRGRWHSLSTPQGEIRALATIGPDLLLTNPALKALAWADLRLLMEGLSR